MKKPHEMSTDADFSDEFQIHSIKRLQYFTYTLPHGKLTLHIHENVHGFLVEESSSKFSVGPLI